MSTELLSSSAENADAVRQRIAELGNWFHNLDLGGVKTAPNHFLGDYPRVKWESFAHAIPEDLSGRSVLDIGCNAGFYSLEMKRRGARRVVAIDCDEKYLAQARFAAELCDFDIEFRNLSVYQLDRIGEKFDVVILRQWLDSGVATLHRLKYQEIARHVFANQIKRQ